MESETRSFIIDGLSDGYIYIDKMPGLAAKKAAYNLFKKNDRKKKIIFSLREMTKGRKKTIYTYTALKEKLNKDSKIYKIIIKKSDSDNRSLNKKGGFIFYDNRNYGHINEKDPILAPDVEWFGVDLWPLEERPISGDWFYNTRDHNEKNEILRIYDKDVLKKIPYIDGKLKNPVTGKIWTEGSLARFTLDDNNSKSDNIFTAVKKLKLHDVQNFLDKGVDPNSRTLEGYNVIDTLINTTYRKRKSIPILKLLIDRGAEIYNSLYTICSSEDYDYFQFVLDMKVDMYTYKKDDYGRKINLLETAITVGDQNHLNMVGAYNLNNLYYVNPDGNTLLHIVVMDSKMFDPQNINLKVSFLYVNRFHKNNEGKTAYEIAINKLKDHIFTDANDEDLVRHAISLIKPEKQGGKNKY